METLQDQSREHQIDALLDDLSVTENSHEAALKAKELYRLISEDDGEPRVKAAQLERLSSQYDRILEAGVASLDNILNWGKTLVLICLASSVGLTLWSLNLGITRAFFINSFSVLLSVLGSIYTVWTVRRLRRLKSDIKASKQAEEFSDFSKESTA